MRTATPLLALLLLACSATLPAAENRYGDWRAADRELESLVDQLQQLLDAGRQARAGHPTFLDDLQALVDRYRQPRRTLLLEETLADGETRQAPAWTASGSAWRVSDGRLHSQVLPAPGGGGTQRERNVKLLIGILGELTGDGSGEGAAGASDVPAQLRTELAIDNAFALELTLERRGSGGEFAIGILQGASPASGYRLLHAADGRWQLERHRQGRAEPVASGAAGAGALDLGRAHRLLWQRRPDGRMTLAVDGEPVLEAQDRTYRDPFTGLLLVNRQGDWSVGEIALYAER